MPIALARRYRPRRFADLVVQDHVAAALRGAVARNRVGHGYLLTGPRGVGKTTAARILAMALNCENRRDDGEPCGECPSCLKIWNGSTDIDVVEIDAASNRGVDDARNLRESAMYAASQAGHHRVYIVDEAHMLTREAWNVLLKILEEPPPGVIFVFATTEPQKIANAAAPVMSRLQRFDFRRIGPAAIHARLREVLAAENLDAEDDALRLIARHADGGMRDALSVLDQTLSFGEGILTAARVRQALGLPDDEAYEALLVAVADRRPGDIFAVLDRVIESGADLAEFAGGLGEFLRAVVMRHFEAEPPELTESARTLVSALSPRLSAEDAVRMLKLLGEAEPALRRSPNPRIVLETLLLRWAMMDRAVELRTLIEGLDRPIPQQKNPETGVGSAGSATRRLQGGAVGPLPSPSGPTRETANGAAAGPAALPGASEAIALTGESLEATWPDIIATATRQSPLLGQALAHATPALDNPGSVSLTFGPESGLFLDGAARQVATIETILGAAFGRTVKVRLQAASGTPAPDRVPKRMSVEDVRNERLSQLRARDPALDAAAKALDLELVDDE